MVSEDWNLVTTQIQQRTPKLIVNRSHQLFLNAWIAADPLSVPNFRFGAPTIMDAFKRAICTISLNDRVTKAQQMKPCFSDAFQSRDIWPRSWEVEKLAIFVNWERQTWCMQISALPVLKNCNYVVSCHHFFYQTLCHSIEKILSRQEW